MSDTVIHHGIRTGPAVGRYPRGEETRQRIIDTAVEIFGRQGFGATSTRDIAVAAGIKTPAIQYYFGSKLGLYDACIEQLTAAVARRITPELEQYRAAIAGGGPLDVVIAALCRVQDCLIDSFFDAYEGYAIQRLLAWEDVENTLSASDRLMKERIGLPILETFRAAVACAMTSPAPTSEVEIQAMALMGITMIFHTNRKRVQELLHQSGIDDTFLRTLKHVARQQVTFILSGLARQPSPAIPSPTN